MSWPKILKIVVLKCHLLLFCATTMNHFWIRLWCGTKVDFIQQPATASSVAEPRSSKAFPKAKRTPKKSHGHWWFAGSLIHYSFLNPSKTIITSEICSANQWDALRTAMPEAGTGQQKGPNSSARQHPTPRCTNTSKVELIGLHSFASSAIFTQPLDNWLLLFQASWQLFAGKTLSQSAWGRKCFPRVCRI